MAMALITPAATLPVSLTQVKTFLKVENTDDDILISDLINQAVTYIENYTGQKLITQTWRLFFDELPAGAILELALAPVISLTAFRYFDASGDAQIVAPGDYELDMYSNPARLVIKNAISPGPHINGLEIDLQVGFGASSVDVPGDILRAIMVTIAHWYEFRGAVHPGDQPLSSPAGLSDLLAPYRKAKL